MVILSVPGELQACKNLNSRQHISESSSERSGGEGRGDSRWDGDPVPRSSPLSTRRDGSRVRVQPLVVVVTWNAAWGADLQNREKGDG